MRKPIVHRLGFALLSSLAVVAAVACGDKEGAGAKNPGSSGSSSGDENAGAFSSSGGGTSSSGGGAESSSGGGGGASSSGAGTSGGNTTTQLGDGGDLQGAKLGGKVHTENESKGDGGPKGGHGKESSQEPGRTAKDIQAIVNARRDEARACYDKGLTAHPGIEGDLDVKWVIDPTGAVTDASIDTTKSTILEPSVGGCVIDVIKKIKFAASAKGFETRAHYPFNFHPKTFTPKDAGAK